MVKRKSSIQDGGSSAKVHGAISLSVSGRPRLKKTRRKHLVNVKVVKMLAGRNEDVNRTGDADDTNPNHGDVASEASGSAGGNGEAQTPGCSIMRDGSKEFLSSGRTGRRNALPNILGQCAATGTGDLPARLEALTTDSGESSECGTSRRDDER